jgi:hypothetical protein
MISLALEIRKTERIYRQVRRSECAALYAVFTSGREYNPCIGYEAFKIRKRPPEVIFGRQYDARELYPANEDFGRTAWSFGRKQFKEAFARFEALNVKASDERSEKGRAFDTDTAEK